MTQATAKPATESSAATAAEHGDDHDDHHVHVLPLSMYLGVWGALMVGTVITVWVAGFDFGEFNIWVAMAIAVGKATLVGLFFMHLAYDRVLYGVILVSSLLFVGLFIALSALDTHQYSDQMRTDLEIVLPPPGGK